MVKKEGEGKERKIMVFGRVRTSFIFAQEILKKQSAFKLSSHSGYFEGLKPSRSQNTSKGEQSRKRKEKKKLQRLYWRLAYYILHAVCRNLKMKRFLKVHNTGMLTHLNSAAFRLKLYWKDKKSDQKIYIFQFTVHEHTRCSE